ncbi:MAG: TorF family putative porin [Erythrobacter sp.]|uniref:TorF family putative porin n=1 Tax=Erythrobacter sp. TaxID=1042 RepID=UPI0032EE5D7F
MRAPIAKQTASGLSGAGFTVMANATLASEYRFRGVDLSGGDPALQGGIDVVHDSGFYAGTFASTLDETSVGYGAIELDVYGGWSGDVGEGLNANIGIIAYTFPDAGPGNFDYVELYGSIGFTLGPAQATVGAAWDVGEDGLDFAGLRRDNLYLYTDLSAGLPGTPVTVNAHFGYTDGALDFAGDSQSFDWSLGADWAIRDTPLVLGVAYVDAADDVAPPGAFNPTSSTLLGTLTAYF